MPLKLERVIESSLPLCRLLYAEATENAMFSASGLVLQNFDQAMQRGDTYFKLAVIEDKVVGLVGLEQIRLIDRAAHIMIAILPEERGKHLSKPIFKMLIKEGVDNLNLRRIVSISLENSAPEKVLTDLGFNLEGILVEDKWKDGKYHNAVILGWNKGKDNEKNIPKTS